MRISPWKGWGICRDESRSRQSSLSSSLQTDYLEQWHDSMHEGGRTLSTADKTVDSGNISKCCSGKLKTHRGYEFRRVTTEKRKDFDKDGKRTVPHNHLYKNTKKRKRD